MSLRRPVLEKRGATGVLIDHIVARHSQFIQRFPSSLLVKVRRRGFDPTGSHTLPTLASPKGPRGRVF